MMPLYICGPFLIHIDVETMCGYGHIRTINSSSRQVLTPLFTWKLSNAQVMFNKFDHFNVNNWVVTWNV